MEKRVKKMAILARPSPGFMGGALLAMLATVSPVHAGWLVEGIVVVGVPGDDGAGTSSGTIRQVRVMKLFHARSLCFYTQWECLESAIQDRITRSPSKLLTSHLIVPPEK